MRSRKRSVALVAVLCSAATGSAAASTVSTNSTQGGTAQNPTTVTTITITPASGERIRALHVFPTGDGTDLHGTITGLPAGWEDPSGSGTQKKGWHFKAPNGSSPALPATPSSTITIEVAGAPSSQTWTHLRWTTSSDASSSEPSSGSTGHVDGGTTTPGTGYEGWVPVSLVRVSGPGTIAIDDTGLFLATAAIEGAETLTYTVFVSRSLDPLDSTVVDKDDPVPASWELGLSTNSRTGTTTVSQGVITATYYADSRNHVLIEVPDRTALIGETFYIQVEFSDGEVTAPHQVTIGT